MPKLKLEDLDRIAQRMKSVVNLREGVGKVRIIVHMGTCGIAAGAREVMSALQEEIIRTERHDIVVENSGCIGKCSSEPNVTVEIEGEEPVIYQLMNADNMRRVFEEHIINGKVSEDLVLT